MTAVVFRSVVQQSIDDKTPLHLPVIQDDPQDELTRRRLERSGQQPEVQTLVFINPSIEKDRPLVVWADLVGDGGLTWVHIQADGDVVSFDVVNF